jgi:hypothetical protein
MQFIVMGYDGKDDKALERRLAMREEHLAGARLMKTKGQLLYAAALLDDLGHMIGSMMVVDYSDRDALDVWLTTEPYIVGEVWKSVEVTTCKVPDFFQ